MSKDSSAGCYQKTNKRLKKSLLICIKTLLKKKKNRKREYGRERYKNLSENAKQRLVEHRKRYYKMRKNKMSYKHQKRDLSYQIIQINAKISF